MKKLIPISLLFLCVSAQAIPNVWNNYFDRGYEAYAISDGKDRTLRVYCNPYPEAEDMDHLVLFEIGDETYENTNSKYPLAFLLDDATQVTPAGSTNWKNGAVQWDNFARGISKARKIDVYLNNKKVTTFTPPQANVNAVVKELANCQSK